MRHKLISMLDKIRPLKKSVFADLDNKKNIFFGRVLDYGCGRQPYKEQLSKLFSEVVGIDIANKYDKEVFLFEDSLIPLSLGKFDCIVLFDVFQHLKDPDASIKNIFNTLNSHGYVYMTVPYIYPECDYSDFSRWTKIGITNYLESSGFSVISIEARAGLLQTFFLCLLQLIFNFIIGTRKDWKVDMSNIRSSFLIISELCFIPILYLF